MGNHEIQLRGDLCSDSSCTFTELKREEAYGLYSYLKKYINKKLVNEYMDKNIYLRFPNSFYIKANKNFMSKSTYHRKVSGEYIPFIPNLYVVGAYITSKQLEVYNPINRLNN